MVSIQLIVQNLPIRVVKLPSLQRVLPAFHEAGGLVSRLFVRAVSEHEIETHLRAFPQLVTEVGVGAVIRVNIPTLLDAQAGGPPLRAITINDRLINRLEFTPVVQPAKQTQV